VRSVPIYQFMSRHLCVWTYAGGCWSCPFWTYVDGRWSFVTQKEDVRRLSIV
jgi:hypothetical protein